MSQFLLTHQRYGICVSDRPLGVFDRGHDPNAYRKCLPAIEAHYSDTEAWEALFPDAVFEVDEKKPNAGPQLCGGRIFHFKATYGNCKGGKGKRRR